MMMTPKGDERRVDRGNHLGNPRTLIGRGRELGIVT
jgi:hypothetical protein